MGLALGRGPARLAHRVLGDGAHAPRRELRPARRRPRPDLPAPRERARAVRGRAGEPLRARVDAQRDARLTARRCRSRSATSTAGDALERGGRETMLVFFAQAQYRSPVDYSDVDTDQARRTNEACARPCAARGATPRGPRAVVATAIADDAFDASTTPWPRPRHAGRAGRAARTGGRAQRAVAGGQAAPDAVGGRGRRAGARPAGVRPGTLDARPTARSSDEVRGLLAEREEARAARDWARAEPRDASPRRLHGSRHAAGARARAPR